MIYGLFESTFCLTLDSQGAMYAVADMDNGYIVVDNTTAAAHWPNTLPTFSYPQLTK